MMVSPPETAASPDLVDVIDEVQDVADGVNNLTVHDLIDRYDGRAYGLWILVPSALVLSPLGAIPLVPTVGGITIATLSLQALLGRDRPWLPGRLRRQTLPSQRVKRAAGWLRPVARLADRLVRPRLTGLVSGPAQFVLAAVVTVLALAMIPLEVVPLAGALPSSAIVLIALGLTARDGLLIVAAALLTLATTGALSYLAIRLLQP